MPLWASLLTAVLLAGFYTVICLWCQPNSLRYTLGVLVRQPLLIVMMGIMMVLTTLSDIIQIGSIKIRHKKVFRMAPLHHHFELGGVPETKIVAMYTLVTAIACVIALLSLSF